MSERKRLRLVVAIEYDADPSSYGTDDVHSMAAIDTVELGNDLDYVVDFMLNPPATSDLVIEVTPAQ